MRLTLRQLQIFIAVARTGSTTAAAKEIALSQSATSAALNELESLLGGRLFDRVGKRLVLNDHGRAMLPEARWVLDGAQSIESQFSRTGAAVAPRFRIAASTTIGNYRLPGLIASYCRARGAGEIEVRIGNTEQVAAAVAGFDVDLGFIEGPCHQPEVRAIPWMRDSLVIVCSPAHELAGRGGATADLGGLQQATWLLRERGSGTREAVEHALLPTLHRLQSNIQLGSAEAIKHAAAEGLGVTCLSLSAVKDMVELGRLVILKTPLPPLHRLFYLIHHERKFISASLEEFMAHCMSSTDI